MHSIFPNVTIAAPDPHYMLASVTLNALSLSSDFKEIQQVLSEQCLALFGLTVDFTKRIEDFGIIHNYLLSDDCIKAINQLFKNNSFDKEYIELILSDCLFIKTLNNCDEKYHFNAVLVKCSVKKIAVHF